jgi:hypothetical protein
LQLPKSDSTAKKILRDECKAIISKISTALEKSLSKITITLDIWTQPGMKFSYLGVTAHFIDCSFQALRLKLIFLKTKFTFIYSVFLGLHELPPSHTAVVVKTHLDKILSYYKIDEDALFSIITDNGSNVVCAFKDDYQGCIFHINR